MLKKMLRPDSKGRITLGVFAKGVSSFLVTQQDNKLILIPYVEIPAYEKWLFNNEIALKKVRQGIKDVKLNHVSEKGSFAKYIEDDDT